MLGFSVVPVGRPRRSRSLGWPTCGFRGTASAACHVDDLSVKSPNGSRDLVVELYRSGSVVQRKPVLQDPRAVADSVAYVVTIIGGASETDLVQFFDILTEYASDISGTKRLSGLNALCKAWEVHISMAAPREGQLRAALWQFTEANGIDAAVQRDSAYRRSKRLAIFDLDSTLIQMETADAIAKEVNKEEEVSEITTRAMNGLLGFRESLEQRVALLKGTPEDALEALTRNIPYTAGAPRLIRALTRLGCTTCICSGGFTFLTDAVRKELGMDASFSNVLEVSGGELTGSVVGPIVDAERKLFVLETLRTFLQLEPEQVLAVGDGANDLPMLAEAGLGVAFNAKPKVQLEARFRLNQPSMESILYLLGLSDDDIGKF